MTREWKRAALIALTVVSSAAGAAGLWASLFVGMVFDAPGSNTPVALGVFAGTLALPVVCFACVLGSWLLFGRNRSGVGLGVAVLPIVYVVVAAILLSKVSGARYEKTGAGWAFVTRNFTGGRSTAFDADEGTFEIIRGRDGEFAKDKDHVFWRGRVLANADPREFRLLEAPYATDGTRVYCGTVAMEDVRVDEFAVVRFKGLWQTYKDKRFFVADYGDVFETLTINAELPAIVGLAWARDGKRYYHGPATVEDADYATFTIDGSFMAHDRERKYIGAFPRDVQFEREKRLEGNP
jgi:hypothetical protein